MFYSDTFLRVADEKLRLEILLSNVKHMGLECIHIFQISSRKNKIVPNFFSVWSSYMAFLSFLFENNLNTHSVF